jgi:hypothetical protein
VRHDGRGRGLDPPGQLDHLGEAVHAGVAASVEEAQVDRVRRPRRVPASAGPRRRRAAPVETGRGLSIDLRMFLRRVMYHQQIGLLILRCNH